MRMTKKVVSLVLAVMMVASLAVVGTVVASAATVTTYEQFKDAINSNPYGTVTLDADIEGTEQLTFTKTVTIDLNGHSITNNAPAPAKGDFIIGDGGYCNVQFKGTGTVNLNNWYYGFRMNSGALNIGANVTFNCPNGNIVFSGNLTVSGAINTTDWFAIAANGSLSHDYSFRICDGAYVKSTKADAAGIYHCGDGELVIEGGTVEGPSAVLVKSGKTTITGGTLIATGAKTAFAHNGNGADPTGDALVVESCDYPGGTPEIKVTGGTFESANAAPVAAYSQTEANWPAATDFIKGGDFKGAEPVDADCFADGITTTTENGYTVVRSYICEVVGGGKYESVDEAVQAAGEGGTVKLIADITCSGDGNVGIHPNYNTTIDLNGHTITGTQCAAVTIYSNYQGGKTITFTDTSAEQTGAITTTCRYTGDACISDSSGANVVINGGTYTSDKKALYISSDEGWEINGGTFNGDVFVKSDVDINGGEVNGNVVQDSKMNYSTWENEPADIDITGGTFATDVTAFCTGDLVAEKQADGTYAIVTDPLAGDAEIEGYQVKADGTEQSTEAEGNDINTKGVRVLVKVDRDALESYDEYGFVLVKVEGKEQATAKFANMKKSADNGEKVLPCSGTYNTVKGDNYVTLAVNGMSAGDQIAARFYVVKDGVTYYAKYVNTIKYEGILATME